MIPKFRGKRIDNNQWVYGLPVEVGKRCWIANSPRICYYDENSISFLNLYTIEIEPSTLGQNGLVADDYRRDVFEGDNLQITCTCGKSFKATVKRSEATLYIGLSPNCDCNSSKVSDCYYIPLNDAVKRLSDLSYQVEVIGNIHDNPELVIS